MGAVKRQEEDAFQAATERARHCCGWKDKEQERAMAVGAEEEGGRREERELIPGLPDHVAMECLARVPNRSHRRMRHVSCGWRGAVGSAEFRRRRRVAGAAEDIVFLVQAAPVGGDGKGSTPECSLVAANLTTGEWRRVEGAAAAWGPVPLFAQCAAVGDGRHVAVVGGWDPDTFHPTSDVRVLDVPTGEWRRGRQMPDSRSFFGCAGGDGNVYVAGGHDESKNALRSAFVYSVAAEAWRALPDMSEERDEPQLVATPGRVLAASGYPTEAQGAFKETAECYAAGDAWINEGDVVPDTAGMCLASVGGKVWAVGAGKGGVREWDGAARAWRDVADGPPGMKACVKAVSVGDGGAVFVFGKAADAAEGGEYASWVMDASGAPWKRVPVPPGFDGFVYSAAAMRA
ncbi:F-box/kelch-repeat protein At2g44130-like [Phragmites australis]|uniref:F-box/kelch-repeat protein At2g44130-like n=1 Tax=Phragmites australis TaxID=29695 RepID=UPI002D78DE54|nr:F-box/kelch-repeat protein At2g44130-like [Phragmites australis]